MLFTVEDLQKDLQILTQRKDESMQTFHQLVGAISVLEQQINKAMAPEPEPVEPPATPEPEVIEPVEVSD